MLLASRLGSHTVLASPWNAAILPHAPQRVVRNSSFPRLHRPVRCSSSYINPTGAYVPEVSAFQQNGTSPSGSQRPSSERQLADRGQYSNQDVASTSSSRTSFTQRTSTLENTQPAVPAAELSPGVSISSSDPQACNNNNPSSSSTAASASSQEELEERIRFALNFAWGMNLALLVAKMYAFHISNSKAVLASLADSVVDLVSQMVILFAAAVCKRPDLKHYPVGRARLEGIGVLACACIMSVCAVEVIKSGVADLYAGWVLKDLPQLDTSMVMYSILFVATSIKMVAYWLCAQLQSRSDFMVALAEDQLNDVMSNTAALVAGGLAGLAAGLWWVDAVGAILISLYIVYRWAQIAINQVDKIVGRAAPEEVVCRLSALADGHHDQMRLSRLRAYHFGSKVMVEAEVVMPGELPLKKVHGIALKLQCKLESLEEVERAFVHVDYRHRPEPTHKVERQLMGLPPNWAPAAP